MDAVPAPSTGSEILVQDFDVARALLHKLYGRVDADLRYGAAGRFAWRVKRTQVGVATVIAGWVGSDITLQATEAAHYAFGTTRSGCYEASCKGGRVLASPGTAGLMFGPGTRMSVRAPESTVTLNVSIPASAVLSHLTALTGAPAEVPPHFAPHVDLRRGGADVLRLAHLLHEAAERPDGPLASPHVLGHLGEALCGALLLGLESSVSHLLHRPAPLAGQRVVKEVEEYLIAHAAEPLSIAELASRTGVGLRSLERSFKAVHGCSIREYLKSQRLLLARRRLAAAAPGTTVTQVLFASGFSHPGEFSVAYRKRFRESPSETLRRAR